LAVRPANAMKGGRNRSMPMASNKLAKSTARKEGTGPGGAGAGPGKWATPFVPAAAVEEAPFP
jgi:hypothetical protein